MATAHREMAARVRRPVTEDLDVPNADIVRAEPTPIELIQHAVDKGIDPEKLTVLVDLKDRIDRQNAAKDYARALAQFQSQCPRIKKTRGVSLERNNPSARSYSYAAFEDIMGQIAPILETCGLTVSFDTELAEAGKIKGTCRVRHGLHVEASSVTLPVPAGMHVNDTQKMGAAISYAKRYALCAALNIVVCDEDRDAGGVVATVTEEQADTLDDMIREAGVDKAKFLKWAGANRLSEVPAAKFHDAMRDLQTRLNQRRGGGKP